MIERIVAILCVIALCSCSGKTQQPSDVQPSVETTLVRNAAFTQTVTAVGRVGAPAGSQSRVSFAEAGILQSVSVQVGEHVSAGEALAQLDTSGLSLAAQQAAADARAAAANATQSAVDKTSTRIAVDEDALRREQSLYAAGVAPLKDVQAAQAQLGQDRADAATARAGVAGANAQEQSAQVRSAIAQRDLSNGTLRSPSDGIVTAVLKHAGEAVDTTTPVIAIGPSSTHDVTLTLAPSDAALVRRGDAAKVSIPGTALHAVARVTGVSSAVDPTTQASTVVLSGLPVGAPEGSAVQATIAVAHDSGIVIPQSAVVQDPQTGSTLVFVQQRDKNGDLKFASREVTVARQNGTRALISSGLRPGERIATQGAFALLAPAGGD